MMLKQFYYDENWMLRPLANQADEERAATEAYPNEETAMQAATSQIAVVAEARSSPHEPIATPLQLLFGWVRNWLKRPEQPIHDAYLAYRKQSTRLEKPMRRLRRNLVLFALSLR